MRKLIALTVLSIITLVSMGVIVRPVFAQEDSSYYTTTSYSTGYDDVATTAALTAATTAATLFGGAMIAIYSIIGIASYVYMALALMKIAQKLNYKNAWFAWVPILNSILVFELGDKNPVLLFLLLIPGIGALIVAVIGIIALMNICEKMGHDKMLGLLTLVPVANYILFGVLAWGKSTVVTPAQTSAKV